MINGSDTRPAIKINQASLRGFDKALDDELNARRGSLKVAQALHLAGLRSVDVLTPAAKAAQGVLNDVRFAAELRRKTRNG